MDIFALGILKYLLFGVFVGATHILRFETIDELYECVLGDAEDVPIQKILAVLLAAFAIFHLIGLETEAVTWILLVNFLCGLAIGEIINYLLPDFMGSNVNQREEYFNYTRQERRKTEYEYSPYWKTGGKRDGKPLPPVPRTSAGPTPLEILKLQPGVSLKQAKAQYRKLARKYHPDIVTSNGGTPAQIEKAQRKMQTINIAFDWCEQNL